MEDTSNIEADSETGPKDGLAEEEESISKSEQNESADNNSSTNVSNHDGKLS